MQVNRTRNGKPLPIILRRNFIRYIRHHNYRAGSIATRSASEGGELDVTLICRVTGNLQIDSGLGAIENTKFVQ
jgi:hypothetical protein